MKTKTSATAKIIFQPSGRRGQIPIGSTIIEASRQLGVDIEAPCGEHQVCGKCKVRIEEGVFDKFGIRSYSSHASGIDAAEEKQLTKEEIQDGYRLGCSATVKGDLLIYVPESSRAGKQVVSKAARHIDIVLNPAVKNYTIQVQPPTLDDSTADGERVLKTLAASHKVPHLRFDVHALRNLSTALRDGNWEITVSVWMEQEIIRVTPGSAVRSYGMAFDLGTTTIAGYLCDLESGQVIQTVSAMNPQVKYGEDVVSRISYHMGNPGGLSRMSSDLITTMNRIIDKAIAAPADNESSEPAENPNNRVSREDILDIAVCSNTAMHHILLQLDPSPLGEIPFTPSIHHSLDMKGRDLGLNISPGANVFFLPSIAGYVGGDTVGVMLSENPQESVQTQLLIDIGTNGELVLCHEGGLLCSSCATGPALEGAQITFGMRAAPGAIERVKIDPDSLEVDYKVIGRKAWKHYSKAEEMKTRGICGSGIIDVVAELLLSGIISQNGAFSDEAKRSNRFRINQQSGFKEFVVAWADETSIGQDVVVTQKDIRQIQMAKASIYTGCKLMMKHMGVETVDIIKIAGAFGTHIDRNLAREIGMIPDCSPETVVSVGNAAGDGCRAALLSVEKRSQANLLRRNISYLELTLVEDFQNELVGATQFPHMRDEFPFLQKPLGSD